MKKKREIDWDYIIKLSITWLAIFALLLAMSIAILSCSATFIKGHHNNSSSAEAVEADGDELELMGRHKKGIAPEIINDTIQPLEIVKDSIPLDTVSE